MKTPRSHNKNHQKQEQVNILSYFNGPKLYKRQYYDALIKQGYQRNNRKSPVSMKSYRQRSDSQNNELCLTTRNAYVSLENQDCEKSQFSGYDTSRENSKQQQIKTNFQFSSESKDVKMVKKQIGSNQKKRFYYKEEYDSIQDGQKLPNGKLSKNTQSKTILPDYFTKLNSRPRRFEESNSSQVDSQKQKRSLSPLEESQQQLFAKCYKETSHHLELMLKEIHESQDNLSAIHQKILDNILDTVKARATFLRSQLIVIVENLLDEWESNEWKFLQQNQILFIDDLLELKEQLNEREIKVKLLIQRLEKQKSQSWIVDRKHNEFNGDIPKAQNIWKNVTTDLLMFNYEDSIMEIQQLSDKILSSVPQKCRKAIEILPSFQSHITNGNNNVASDAFFQLKASIMKTIIEISHTSKNNPEYLRQINRSRKYSETTEFSNTNLKKNICF